jgi:hypothetical protein
MTHSDTFRVLEEKDAASAAGPWSAGERAAALFAASFIVVAIVFKEQFADRAPERRMGLVSVLSAVPVFWRGQRTQPQWTRRLDEGEALPKDLFGRAS